jgi:hypothetical protein
MSSLSSSHIPFTARLSGTKEAYIYIYIYNRSLSVFEHWTPYARAVGTQTRTGWVSQLTITEREHIQENTCHCHSTRRTSGQSLGNFRTVNFLSPPLITANAVPLHIPPPPCFFSHGLVLSFETI